MPAFAECKAPLWRGIIALIGRGKRPCRGSPEKACSRIGFLIESVHVIRPASSGVLPLKTSSHLPAVAYFSMEIALHPDIPTYSGGLGVLAGDTLRSAADLGVPMVAVSLLHRKGYFRQRLDADGVQHEESAEWSPEQFLEPMRPVASIGIAGREVHVRAWRYLVEGITGHVVPVYLLDT